MGVGARLYVAERSSLPWCIFVTCTLAQASVNSYSLLLLLLFGLLASRPDSHSTYLCISPRITSQLTLMQLVYLVAKMARSQHPVTVPCNCECARFVGEIMRVPGGVAQQPLQSAACWERRHLHVCIRPTWASTCAYIRAGINKALL